MNYSEAVQMKDEFAKIGGFDRIEVVHWGYIDARTPKTETDGKWLVELWSVNARAGNRTLETVREFEPKLAGAIARKAKGKATARDKAAFARMAAEHECNRS